MHTLARLRGVPSALRPNAGDQCEVEMTCAWMAGKTCSEHLPSALHPAAKDVQHAADYDWPQNRRSVWVARTRAIKWGYEMRKAFLGLAIVLLAFAGAA